MKKFTKVALIGIVGFALVACDDNDTPVLPAPPAPPAPPAVVTYASLLDTGEMGYKINVDMNDSQNQFSGFNLYICTDSPKVYDYFLHDPSDGGEWNRTNLPNFDYGHLVAGQAQGELQFESHSGGAWYSIDSVDENLTEGQTYDLTVLEDPILYGTVDINSISDFNCTTIQPPA